MSKILKELKKFCKLAKGDRQEALEKLVRSAAKLEEDDWTTLSEETQKWVNSSVKLIKKHKPVVDPDAAEEDEEDDLEERPPKAKKKAAKPEDDESCDEDDEPPKAKKRRKKKAAELEPDEDDEEEIRPRKARRRAAVDEDDESCDEDEDDEDDEPPKAKKRRKKKAAEDEDDEPPKAKKRRKKKAAEPELEDDESCDEDDEPPKAKKSKKKSTKTARKRKDGLSSNFVQALFENPDLDSVDEILKTMDEDCRPTDSTATVLRYNIQMILATLKKMGKEIVDVED